MDSAERAVIIQQMHQADPHSREARLGACSDSQNESPVKQEWGEAAQRRRLKRRRNKERQRARQHEAKEKAMAVFQDIIRDIYALRTTYQTELPLLEQCILLEDNPQTLYDAMDSIMRAEIDLIRRRIAAELNAFALHPQPEEQERSIGSIFECVRRILEGSPEIEKIINLFVQRRFGGEGEAEEPPIRTNLDRMTLKFLYRNDLLPSPHFAAVVRRIAQEHQFHRERLVYQAMRRTAALPDPHQLDCSSESEEETACSKQQAEEDKAEEQWQQEEETRRRRKRGRRKAGKGEQHETTFESILQRTQELSIDESQRVECKVEEEWVWRMRERGMAYRRPH